MARIVQVPARTTFASFCVVCLSPADKHYTIDRTFSYGRASQTIELAIPLCEAHFRIATRKSSAEILVGRIGLWAGILTGLLVGSGLFIYWIGSRQGMPLLNMAIALVIGAGFFLILWSSTLFWLAPRFADPQSRQVREAVRILRFWPGEESLELEFQNDQAADLLAPETPPAP